MLQPSHNFKKEYAAFQEKIRKFEGFYIQKRSLRDYQVSVGANVFGSITQASEKEVAKNQKERGDEVKKNDKYILLVLYCLSNRLKK